MTETKMEVIKLMPKEYTQAEANAFKHGFFLGAKSERNELVQEAVEWMKLYVVNHDAIDVFEMEKEFKKVMEDKV